MYSNMPYEFEFEDVNKRPEFVPISMSMVPISCRLKLTLGSKNTYQMTTEA
jgi:hypothetical protein